MIVGGCNVVAVTELVEGVDILGCDVTALGTLTSSSSIVSDEVLNLKIWLIFLLVPIIIIFDQQAGRN